MSEEENCFEIDGRQYPYPGLVGLTMRECRIFREETGVVYESLWLDNLSVRDLFLMDGFLAAMARIAYTREHPETLDDDVKAVIDRQNRISLFATLTAAFRPDEPASEDPKEQEPTRSSPTKSEPGSKHGSPTLQPESSGTDSTPNTGQPDSSPERIGTGESDTPSTSVPLRQVI